MEWWKTQCIYTLPLILLMTDQHCKPQKLVLLLLILLLKSLSHVDYLPSKTFGQVQLLYFKD